MHILLNWIKPNLNCWINFWIEFFRKKSFWIIFWIEHSRKKINWIILWIEFYCKMTELIIFWIDICHFWLKVPFFVYFGHFLGTFSIRPVSMTVELNYLLNLISRIIFKLNNILNWIIGKAKLNRILNESFFGKIQTLNWIRLGIGHH